MVLRPFSVRVSRTSSSYNRQRVQAMCGAVGIPTPTYKWRDVGCVAVWHNVLLFVLKAILHAVAMILHRHSSTITFQNTCGSEIDQLCCEISRWNMLPLLLMSVKNQCLTEVPNFADKNICMQISSVEALYPKDACECLTKLLLLLMQRYNRQILQSSSVRIYQTSAGHSVIVYYGLTTGSLYCHAGNSAGSYVSRMSIYTISSCKCLMQVSLTGMEDPLIYL